MPKPAPQVISASRGAAWTGLFVTLVFGAFGAAMMAGGLFFALFDRGMSWTDTAYMLFCLPLGGGALWLAARGWRWSVPALSGRLPLVVLDEEGVTVGDGRMGPPKRFLWNQPLTLRMTSGDVVRLVFRNKDYRAWVDSTDAESTLEEIHSLVYRFKAAYRSR